MPLVRTRSTVFGCLLRGLAISCVLASGAARAEPSNAPASSEPPSNETADAEAQRKKWEAESARLQTEREALESRRLEELADRLRLTEDAPTLRQGIAEIRSSILVPVEARSRLLSTLLEHQVELWAKNAANALAAGDEPQGRTLIIEAEQALAERGADAPEQTTVALARAREAYVETTAALAERAASAGDVKAAREHLERARGLAPTPDAPGGSGERASVRLKKAERTVALASTGAIVATGREAEQRKDFRRALLLYGSAERHGADVKAAIERVESERRSPLAEAGMSLLVPGLGQLTHDRALAGSLFLGGTAAAIAGGVLLNVSAEKRYDRYKAATTAENAADRYDGIQARWVGALVLFGVAAVLHVWNVHDAYTDANDFNLDHF